MKIAVITPTTFPSCLPYDSHVSTYGSEWVGSSTIKYFLDLGPKDIELEFYAPIGSTNFQGNDRVTFHPLKNTYGQHPPNSDDRLEEVCFEHGTKSEDLLKCDFVIDMSKFCCSVEDLYYYHKFRKFVLLRSGHQDYFYPWRIQERHYVVHNKYYTELFGKAGHPVDYVHHGIDPFWCPGDSPEHWTFFEDKGLTKKGYHLYAHRPSPEKGLGRVVDLAIAFPSETFVVSTSANLPDHRANINIMLKGIADHGIKNLLYIPCPTNNQYHYYRRELLRHCKSSLCVWLTDTFYVDMIGYIGLESLACGAPLIASKAAGSLSILGEEAHEKSVLYIDGLESCKYAIKHFDSYSLKGTTPEGWTPQDTVNKYMELIKKYS